MTLPPRQSVPQALVRLHPARRVETPHEAALRRARRREGIVAVAGTVEEIAETTRLWRPPDPPLIDPADGGCVTCQHTVRVHEAGYNERRVPCKALGCDCPKWRPYRTWLTYLWWFLVGAFWTLVLLGIVAFGWLTWAAS